MREHDHEQRQILQHVPDDRGIPAFSALDLIGCHEKPGPVQKQINSGEAKQMDRTLANTRHVGSLRYSDSSLRSTASRIRIGSSLPFSFCAARHRLTPSAIPFAPFSGRRSLLLRSWSGAITPQCPRLLPSKPCDGCTDASTPPACTMNIDPL